MQAATAKQEAKAPTNQEIQELKTEIRNLYPDYRRRRLELGIRLLRLQEMLAHPGHGTFVDVVTKELAIPKSTVYDLIDFAKYEIDQAERKRLSEIRKDEDPEDCTVDLNNESEVAKLISDAYGGRPPDPKPRGPKPYPDPVYVRLFYTKQTREKVAAAWDLLKDKKYEAIKKGICMKFAKEVIRAAAKIEKSSK